MPDLPDLSQFQAVVFDMDGTLVDSEAHCCAAVVSAMATFGLKLTPDDYYRRFSGRPDKVLAKLLHDELNGAVDQETIHHSWYDQFHQLRAQHGLPVMPGARELLRYFQDRSFPIAIASAADSYDIELNLELAQLTPYFTATASGVEVSASKPAPDVYLLAAARLNASPQRCLAFEDTNIGARAAIAAGMYTFMIPHRCEPDEHVRLHAQGVAESLTEFLPRS